MADYQWRVLPFRRMRLTQFTLDPETGILVPPDAGAPAGYLDGAEQHLLEVLTSVSDRSVASAELGLHMHDWPSRYHLTAYRSTILDCLGFTAGDARVLELGAGCGAITRWLGENCAEVHAIEGSVHRARVARARCADLDNVVVYSANYSELAEEDAFDVVTLIGVLEYGHLYHPRLQGDPRASALENLRIARRALRDEGFLVLALENRLGVKYLNGALEDHSGKRFESVQGYPHATSAVTFSAHDLRSMLATAGFEDVGLYLPYPDYKLATTIVNAEHAGPDSGVHNWLPGTAPDRGAERRAALYHEALAEREFGRAGLLPELANSFLMVAYAGPRALADARHGLQTAWRARHYALDRRPGLGKRVTIGAPGDDVVRNEPVLGFAATGGAGALEHRLADEPLQPGELLVFDVHDAIAGAGYGTVFLDLLARHRDWLVAEFAIGWVDEAGAPLLDGAAFDATWWNIVSDADGRWTWIDREWRFRTPLPLDYVVWRTLFHYAQRFGLHLGPAFSGLDAAGFAEHWLRQLQPELDAARLAQLHALEAAALRSTEAGAPPPAAPTSSGHVCVSASVEEVCTDRDLLAGYVGAFGPDDAVTLHLYVDPEAADARVAQLRETLAALEVPDAQLPDLLVQLAVDGTVRRRMCAASAAVLTREPAPDGDDVPRVADRENLRRLVEVCWATAPLTPAARPTGTPNNGSSRGGRARKLGVVLTYNDEDIAGEVIDHLLANDHDVVVWDNGSGDATWDVVRERKGNLLELRRVPQEELGLYEIYGAMSRHLLERHVSGYDWVSWPDSDEILLADDLSLSYGEFADRLVDSPYDWVQFRNWNFWWTEEDDPAIESPVLRVRHYALFPDCAPRVRGWRAAKTNERAFNHNPVDGPQYPALANLCHYPMRGAEQAPKKLATRAGIQRGDANWHYNKMQRDPTVLRIPAAKLCELSVDPRTPGSWSLTESAFPWRTVYDQ